MRHLYPDERAARAEICATAREVWQRRLGAAGDGNLSVRVGPDRVVTTPRASHKGRLEPSDLVAVDLQGRTLGRGRASSELALHLAAYAARLDVGAVIHAHPPHAIAYNLAGGRLSEVLVSEVVFAFGQVATAPYTTPTTEDVAATLRPYLACYDAVLMARHGSVTLGATLEQAFIRLDSLEHSAQIATTARLLGGGEPVEEAEVDRLYDVATGGRPPPYRLPGNACPPLEPAGIDEGIVRAVLAALAAGGGD